MQKSVSKNVTANIYAKKAGDIYKSANNNGKRIISEIL